jgi:hypothetical protein
MAHTKNDIKQLIAQNRLDEAVDILLELTNSYLDRNPTDKFVAKINNAVLYVIDQLPDSVFQLSKSSKLLESSTTTEQSQLRNGVKLLHDNQQRFEYDIFLSFSSKDRTEARQIWEKLRGYGLRVFLSDEALKINIGTSFFEKINYGLQNSRHLVWLCTPNAVQSKYVKMETETFFNQFFENDRRLIILKGIEFRMDLLLPIYKSLQLADNTEQIVHALIDKAKREEHQREHAKNTVLTRFQVLCRKKDLETSRLGTFQRLF